jgi:hypothetical protein
MMYGLIATQVAFCFVVHLAAGAFVTTLRRLSNQPTGFSAERLLTLETVAKRDEPADIWFQVGDRLRELNGVQSVAVADVALLAGSTSNGFVSVGNSLSSPVLALFLGVSPGWLQTMKIPLLEGRDLRFDDAGQNFALVNLAFAKEYFHDLDPLGRSFTSGMRAFQVVGLVANAQYRDLREPMPPIAYIPFGSPTTLTIRQGTFLVRTTAASSNALPSILRHQVTQARAELRVTNVQTQEELNEAQTVRERLLAALAVFFAGVAIFLAGIGLYGVLEYLVLQRNRELGIRIALGATAKEIALQVSSGIFFMVAFLSAVPAVIRGIRTDPVHMLRAD